MKAIIYISLLVTVTGCSSNQSSVGRWQDMFTDIYLRHRYERYSCASCARRLEGYSKDDPAPAASRRREVPKSEQMVAKASAPDVQSAKQEAQRASASVQELSQKIDVLEEALKTNVAITNQNQNLIVEQVKELKARVEQLQKPAAPPVPVSGVIIPGNQQ